MSRSDPGNTLRSPLKFRKIQFSSTYTPETWFSAYHDTLNFSYFNASSSGRLALYRITTTQFYVDFMQHHPMTLRASSRSTRYIAFIPHLAGRSNSHSLAMSSCDVSYARKLTRKRRLFREVGQIFRRHHSSYPAGSPGEDVNLYEFIRVNSIAGQRRRETSRNIHGNIERCSRHRAIDPAY